MSKLPAIDLKTGWAVRFGLHLFSGSPRAHFVGIYAGDPKVATEPVRVRLWSTRRGARNWLKAQRIEGGKWARENYWRGATPVRVGITIKEIRGS